MASYCAKSQIAKIDALQIEYSPWTTDIEKSKFIRTILLSKADKSWKDGILQAARELGIPVVAYSPLGRGFLTGTIKSPADLARE